MRQIDQASGRIKLASCRARFFSLAPDMLGIVTFDGYYRHLNPSWTHTLGFDASELCGHLLTERVHPEDLAQTRTHILDLTRGTRTARFGNRHLHRDRSYRWLAWSAVASSEEGLIYVSARDVTDAQQAEPAPLPERDLKSQFLATLSHELRAPLAPILGWTAMLRSGQLSPADTARGLEIIQRNVKHQSQILDDLLDASRIGSARLHSELRPTHITPVVKAAIDAASLAAGAKRIELSHQLESPGVEVLGDAQGLQKAIFNIVSNAVEITGVGHRINVSVRATPGEVDIEVEARAHADRDLLPSVADRRPETESYTSPRPRLELKLDVARHIAAAHGGTVREARDPGGYHRFLLTLPLASGRVPSAPPVVTDKTSAGTKRDPLLDGLKVLVVDDAPDIRQLLQFVFERHGARVRCARSAAEALSLIEDDLPEVIVSDIGMAGGDGYDLIYALRSRPVNRGRNIPALALTALASSDDVDRIRTSGFQAHLAKPATSEQIIHAIGVLLAGRRTKARRDGPMPPRRREKRKAAVV